MTRPDLRPVRRSAFFGAVALVLLAGTARTAPQDPRVLLRQDFGFTSEEIAQVARGEVVVRPLTAVADEVAVAAATVIRIPIAFYLERYRQIESFKRSREILQIGRFSTPPAASDLAALALDPGDIEALRECRPGDCAVKLDAAGIARATAPGADVAAVFRHHLAGYAARYLREGDTALMRYEDAAQYSMKDALRQIVGRSRYLERELPALARIASGFDGTLPAGLEHFLYWSKEKPPGKAIVTLTHAIIQPEREGRAAVVTKQIYASHYMRSSLGVTMLLAERGASEQPRTWVIYVNRTHVDLLEGFLSALRRPIIRSRTRSAAEGMLRALRLRLEADFARVPAGG